MSDKTGIEWTDATWNPVTGCAKVSQGCKNCYAERISKRFGKDFSKIELHPERLELPLRWKKPRKIFVNSMSDLFHEAVPNSFIRSVFKAMGEAKQHTFQVLTKRSGRMMSIVRGFVSEGDFATLTGNDGTFPFQNVWLGVSVENQETADGRIPLLLHTPAAIRFVSYEPALGPVMFNMAVGAGRVDWVIAGGESGPNARPSHPDWFRSVRDQCIEADIPFFFKQWGEWTPEFEWLRRIKWSTVKGRIVCAKGHPPLNVPLDTDHLMLRVGKKHAGRALDGRKWNQFPNMEAR